MRAYTNLMMRAYANMVIRRKHLEVVCWAQESEMSGDWRIVGAEERKGGREWWLVLD